MTEDIAMLTARSQVSVTVSVVEHVEASRYCSYTHIIYLYE